MNVYRKIIRDRKIRFSKSHFIFTILGCIAISLIVGFVVGSCKSISETRSRSKCHAICFQKFGFCREARSMCQLECYYDHHWMDGIPKTEMCK